jgi:hypothetical protein
MKISSLQLRPGKWELKLHFYPKLNLTSNVNSFFLAKSQFMRSSEGIKEKLPIKNDEEFSLVAEGGFEPPTFGL